MLPGCNNNSFYCWVNQPFRFIIYCNNSMKSQAVYETELNLDLTQRVPHRAKGQLKHTLDAHGEAEQSFDQEKGARLRGDGLQFQRISYRTLKKWSPSFLSLFPQWCHRLAWEDSKILKWWTVFEEQGTALSTVADEPNSGCFSHRVTHTWLHLISEILNVIIIDQEH